MNRPATSQELPPAPNLSAAWSRLRERGWLSERSSGVSEALRKIARVIAIEPKRNLYYAGDLPDGVYGLVQGALDVSIPRADGQELTIHRADPGFWIGDLALLANQRRHVTVRAASPSILVHLPQAGLNRLLSTMPTLYADFYVLSHRNVETLLRVIGNLSVTPSDARVALRLLFQAEQLPSKTDWIQLSQDKLAELLGLSVPTLQRCLRRLDRDGLVELGYGRVRLRDPQGLQRLSGSVFTGTDSIK